MFAEQRTALTADPIRTAHRSSTPTAGLRTPGNAWRLGRGTHPSSGAPGDIGARYRPDVSVTLSATLRRRTLRRCTWRAGRVIGGPGRSASWFSGRRATRLPGRRVVGRRRRGRRFSAEPGRQRWLGCGVVVPVRRRFLVLAGPHQVGVGCFRRSRLAVTTLGGCRCDLKLAGDDPASTGGGTQGSLLRTPVDTSHVVGRCRPGRAGWPLGTPAERAMRAAGSLSSVMATISPHQPVRQHVLTIGVVVCMVLWWTSKQAPASTVSLTTTCCSRYAITGEPSKPTIRM